VRSNSLCDSISAPIAEEGLRTSGGGGTSTGGACPKERPVINAIGEATVLNFHRVASPDEVLKPSNTPEGKLQGTSSCTFLADSDTEQSHDSVKRPHSAGVNVPGWTERVYAPGTLRENSTEAELSRFDRLFHSR